MYEVVDFADDSVWTTTKTRYGSPKDLGLRVVQDVEESAKVWSL